jgi:hypothetical protein
LATTDFEDSCGIATIVSQNGWQHCTQTSVNRE